MQSELQSRQCIGLGERPFIFRRIDVDGDEYFMAAPLRVVAMPRRLPPIEPPKPKEAPAIVRAPEMHWVDRYIDQTMAVRSFLNAQGYCVRTVEDRGVIGYQLSGVPGLLNNSQLVDLATKHGWKP
jgi:hypothetical protein